MDLAEAAEGQNPGNFPPIYPYGELAQNVIYDLVRNSFFSPGNAIYRRVLLCYLTHTHT